VDALMFVDTSVFVAILCKEPEARLFADKLEQADRRFTSPLVRLEACMVLSTRLARDPVDVETDFDTFLSIADIEVVAITDAVAREAVAAFQRYGKGRGAPAQLNLADCMSYACAKAGHAPILFKGRDFSRTDLKPA
jgi:ribonuclease VapC